MDGDQFQQLLQQLQVGLQPLAGIQQQAPAVLPAQPTFLRTPGQANLNQLLDYTSSAGIKVWQEAMAPLSFKFGVEGSKVNQFCEKLMERAEKQGWNIAGGDMLTIPNSDGNNHNLISEYSWLTITEIWAHMQGYAADQMRQVQNNIQMYHCIMNSLTNNGQLKILAKCNKYTLETPP